MFKRLKFWVIRMANPKMRRVSKLETELANQLHLVGLKPEREFRFAAMATGGTGKGSRARLKASNLKDWRFDFAFLDAGVAVEVEGGTWGAKKSRHTTGSGFHGDCDKYNSAVLLDWMVLRFTAKHIQTGEALRMIETVIGIRKWKKEGA